MRTRSLVHLTFAIGVVSAVSGCRSLPASKPEALWSMEEARGAVVFQQKCARCHYPTTDKGLHGPGLQALTKLKAMPSGAPPTDERLTQTILHGHGMMEAVPVPDGDLQYLLKYLHTL